MKIIISYRVKTLLSCWAIIFFLTTCNQPANNKIPNEIVKKEIISSVKPPSLFSDTIIIATKAAIFFYPDSLQLKKMRADSDTLKFDALLHEYEYQFRYVHNVFAKYWPNIKVIEAKNARYLLFIKVDKSTQIIDLDTKNDPYGLFVFDTSKDPTLLDMTNAESEIGFYFLPNGPQKSK